MRLRLAFKLHGEEADLARQVASMAGIEADKIAKLAMQRYLRDVIERAEEMARTMQQGENNGTQSDSTGTVQATSDAVSSETP